MNLRVYHAANATEAAAAVEQAKADGVQIILGPDLNAQILPNLFNAETAGLPQIVSATNARSAWEIGLDNKLRTLTALEAATAKLRAALDSSRLIDFKKANILARVLSLGDLGSEPAYIVEFSMRSGARAQYYFSVKSGLLTKVTSDTKRTKIVFEDYPRR